MSSQPANADWINAQNEERCEVNRDLYEKESQIISCEWWIAYTHTSGFYQTWKTVKLDKTWKPQKCKCITKIEEWVFSNTKNVKILLDDWLWENNKTK